MKKTVVSFILSLMFMNVFAQDATIRKLQAESLRTVKKDLVDTAWKKWKKGGMYSFSVGQGSQSNWAAGGDDFSLTIATSLNLFGFYKNQKHSWDNTLDINFGYINTTSLGSRKNDDRFDLLTKYGYSLSNKLNLATLVNFRSQFLNGFTYKDTTKTFASTFLSPGYLVTSQGIDYRPDKNFSLFVSPITSRWVFVKNEILSSKGEYGVKPGVHSINHIGAFATVNFQKKFNKIVLYKSRLDLFSNYKTNPGNIDVYMTNTLSAKIARIIAFSWNVDMIYDDDVRLFGENNSSPALQVKSIIGIGLQVKI